jgi:hypothetical protein
VFAEESVGLLSSYPRKGLGLADPVTRHDPARAQPGIRNHSDNTAANLVHAALEQHGGVYYRRARSRLPLSFKPARTGLGDIFVSDAVECRGSFFRGKGRGGESLAVKAAVCGQYRAAEVPDKLGEALRPRSSNLAGGEVGVKHRNAVFPERGRRNTLARAASACKSYNEHLSINIPSVTGLNDTYNQLIFFDGI